jgi:hypothetical protein
MDCVPPQSFPPWIMITSNIISQNRKLILFCKLISRSSSDHLIFASARLLQVVTHNNVHSLVLDTGNIRFINLSIIDLLAVVALVAEEGERSDGAESGGPLGARVGSFRELHALGPQLIFTRYGTLLLDRQISMTDS